MNIDNYDVLVYVGQINTQGYELVSNLLRKKSNEKALLILFTPGGDPHAGFRIARALHCEYDGFDLLVPRFCKSAGTLIAIGASCLYLDDMSELGPLDVQIRKSDEIFELGSGLDVLQGLEHLKSSAADAFEDYLLKLSTKIGLSTRSASRIAADLTKVLIEPISSKIDPNRLAEMQRAISIAYEYGNRLNQKGEILKPNALEKLVLGYPSHGFVIDRKEAKTIFNKVEKPEGDLLFLSSLLNLQTSMQKTHSRNPYVTFEKLSNFIAQIKPKESNKNGSESKKIGEQIKPTSKKSGSRKPRASAKKTTKKV